MFSYYNNIILFNDKIKQLFNISLFCNKFAKHNGIISAQRFHRPLKVVKTIRFIMQYNLLWQIWRHLASFWGFLNSGKFASHQIFKSSSTYSLIHYNTDETSLVLIEYFDLSLPITGGVRVGLYFLQSLNQRGIKKMCNTHQNRRYKCFGTGMGMLFWRNIYSCSDNNFGDCRWLRM